MMKRSTLIILSLLLVIGSAAKVRLPGILSDNMVLQRNAEVNLWGEGKPSGHLVIKTSWNKKTYRVKINETGFWNVKVQTDMAGGPYTIEFNDGSLVILRNVMLGEVWICSGQSNMEMPVAGYVFQPVETGLQTLVEAAEYPDIHLFNVPRIASDIPLTDCDTEWMTPDPGSVGAFSATAYYFGLTLNKILGIPIGLVTSRWGGSAIEAWMTSTSIDGIKGINHDLAKSGIYDTNRPEGLYNGMICPIANFTAKGFIWYQGESNRYNHFDYKDLQIALVKLWRETWGNMEMPFYMVQLAPYKYDDASNCSLAAVVEAQYQAAAVIPHCGVAATTDIGNRDCIHPENKFQVGQRLAFMALSKDYGVKGLPADAPTYRSMEKQGNKLVLTFNNVTEKNEWTDLNSFPLYTPDGLFIPKGFEIAGEDRIFHPAQARMVWWTDKIEVWSDQVPEPVAARYAFHNYVEEANVVTTLGQPLAPFRTDSWPIESMGKVK